MSAFIHTLANYVNDGCLSGYDRIIGAFWSGLPFQLNAGRVLKEHAEDRRRPAGELSMEVAVEPYAGNNRYALEMQEYLVKELYDTLADAVVHGSLGTYEETAYSDFDALVILKDEVLSNRNSLVRTANKLRAARRFMFRMDPLQHHGWFVLTESMLQHYPVAYFPPELFRWSRTLMHPEGSTFALRHAAVQDFKGPLHNLCRSLETKLSAPLPPDLYAMKNLLSEFMLLPALYVQARDGKSLFKKFSFEAARPDFRADVWLAMEEVSAIRNHWGELVPANDDIHTQTAVPGRLHARMTQDLVKRMRSLVKEAREKTP